jgi:hypothetical protein
MTVHKDLAVVEVCHQRISSARVSDLLCTSGSRLMYTLVDRRESK